MLQAQPSAASFHCTNSTDLGEVIHQSKHDAYNYSTVNTKARANLIRSITSSYPEDDTAYYIADIGEVYRQYTVWESNLPSVKPYFAMKSNPDPFIIQLLLDLGLSFDCASKNEMHYLLQNGLNINESASRIIFANPCKPISHLKYAAENGITQMTFDNEDELIKIQRYCPHARLILRVLTEDHHSGLYLGTKFGASINKVPQLLQLAMDLGLNIIGVSFHVGSNCLEPAAYTSALQIARQAFDLAIQTGFKMSVLDIGGGFPGAQHRPIFIEIAASINKGLNEWFADDGIEVIAEPGRFFVESVFTLVTNITSRRIEYPDNNGLNRKPHIMYYLNDGVFGSFLERLILGKFFWNYQILTQGGMPCDIHGSEIGNQPKYDSSLWGPTCASPDCLTSSIELPKLEVGDWIQWNHMGAYTMAFNVEFNGFEQVQKIYTNTEIGSIQKRLLSKGIKY